MHKDELRKDQIKAVDSMLLCCDPSKGFFYYYCSHCDLVEKKHVSCNSSFCTRCGRIMELLGFFDPSYAKKPPPKERLQRILNDWIG